jgi:PAS domain S-box-containing protein
MDNRARILIVDDDARFTKTLSDILRSEGLAPLVAAGGEAALLTADQETPAVAVIDLILQDVPGLEVMKRIKQLNPHIECIVLTGHASQQSAIQAVNLGAYSYLVKPVNIEQLLLTIRRATEKVEAERALRESEEKYRLVVENASEGIALVDFAGNFLEANARALEITGLTREQVVEKNLADVLPLLALDDPSVTGRINDRLAGGPLGIMEVEITSPKGEQLTLLARTSLVHKDGELSGLSVILQDITEQKRAEQELRRLKDFNESIVQNITEGIVIMDLAGRITFTNPAIGTMWGCAPDEWVGKHWTEVVPSDQHTTIAAADQRRLRGESDRYELEQTRNDGTRFQTLVSGSPRFEEGQFAGTMAVITDITEMKRAEDEIRQRTEAQERRLVEMTALYDTSLEIVGQLELPRLLQSFLQRTVSLLGTQAGRVWLRHPPDQELELVADYGVQESLVGSRLSVGEGLAGRVLQTGAASAVEDYQRWEERITRHHADHITAIMCAPLKWGDKIIGVINVYETDTTRRWNDHELRLLTLLANQAAAAIENARLYDETARRAEELAVLYDVSLELAGHLELPPLLDTVVERAIELLGGFSGGMYMYDPEREDLELIAAKWPGKHAGEVRLEVGEGVCGIVAQTGEPLVIADYANWEGRPRQFDAGPTFNVLAVPVKRGQKLLGALYVNDYDVERRFDEADVRLATMFANQAAIAVENARLYEESRRRAEELAALYVISLELVAKTDLSELLPSVLQEAAELLGSDCGGVYLYDPQTEELELRVSHGYTRDYTGLRLAIDEGLAGQVARSRQPLALDDYSKWPDRSDQWAGEGLRAVLAVPLLRGNTLLGVLGLDRKLPGTFEDRDVQLATLFANLASIAIENVRLYEETGRRAEELGTLYDISLDVAGQLDLPPLLETVVQRAIDLLRGDKGGVYLYDEAANELELIHAIGPDQEYVGVRLALGEGACGRAAQGTEPLVVTDYLNWQERSPRFHYQTTFNVLSVPIRRADHLLGVLHVDAMGTDRDFDERDFRLATLFANQAAVAIENAQLLSTVTQHQIDLQRLSGRLIHAQEEERKRISQELHDELGQGLTAMSINLAAIEQSLPEPLDPLVTERLVETKTLVDETLDQMRDLSLELRPSMLDDLGLLPSLRWYVDSYKKRSGVDVVLQAVGLEERFAAEMETVLYRVVQEALTNVARHAEASVVQVRLERTENMISAIIEDDGVGFNQLLAGHRQEPQRGAGLLGMRERIASQGGTLEIESSPGRGTRLIVHMPVAEQH